MAPPRRLHRWVEEFRQMVRLIICDEQNIRLDCDLRGVLRPWLFPFSVVNDSGVVSIAFCR